VERREGLELEDLLPDLGVDQDRLAEARAAVDDPVRDGDEAPAVDLVERPDPFDALVLPDE
jgi:hypothetical protein